MLDLKQREVYGMKRETFGSRLGFILVSAGCAVGIGNVWKFPYMCGQFGGAAFILIYLVFLLIMGIPVMVCEFGVGRASRHSVAAAYETLEPKGTKWHITKWIGIIGFGVCAFGIQKGIEKVSKFMMTALLLIMIVLAIHSVMMKGAGAGIRFYLIPDFKQMAEIGIGNVIFGAMSQAFFTLSIGIGAMLIFGSYMEKDQRLFGEAVNITVLDTIVALMAGFIIIPACFAYGIEPGAGPSLIFITIPNIFAQVAGGRVWGGLFFLFLSFAAFTTLVAVFENIISFDMDLFGWSRKKSTLVSLILIIILSMPCVMGFNVLAGFTPLGEGSTIMDLEDFIVSNNLLPLGSLGYVLFCTKKNGWGWNHFLEEINQGEGWKFPSGIKGYMSYGLPLLIIIIYLKGYYDKFQPMGTKVLVGWMIVAILFLTFVIGCSCGKSNAEKVDK